MIATHKARRTWRYALAAFLLTLGAGASTQQGGVLAEPAAQASQSDGELRAAVAFVATRFGSDVNNPISSTESERWKAFRLLSTSVFRDALPVSVYVLQTSGNFTVPRAPAGVERPRYSELTIIVDRVTGDVLNTNLRNSRVDLSSLGQSRELQQ